MGLLKKDIPSEILDNLNPKFGLRPYQEEAFARFFYYMNSYPEKLNPSHLLFNMATGSGKTLVMAGLILYLYKQGYRNFLFFVNTTNIIEKTKDNFLNGESSKHLFNEKISIDGKFVNIKQVDNFEGVSNDDINICFTTIQKLHTDLHNERENSITYDDFKDKKIVLLSDESHHIQTKTKQKSLTEAMEKPSWENTVEKIFFQNSGNLLLEFTATLDFLDKNIASKYYPKIIYRYDLKEFRNDGYSKDVNILQSDFEEEDRILQAIILSQYRQEVASKHNINLKPVILFKAQKTIEESKANQEKFNTIIERLSESDIANVRERSQVGIIQKAFQFFSEEKITDSLLIQKLKSSFAPNKCINVNEENLDKKSLKQADRQELISQQHLLNSLEDKDNQIRAIFAVQKLNEGWDVLNLFDIVRLYTARDSKGSKIGKTTIAEAQLIGRGARYFPFSLESEQEKYTRKFDEDIENELRILEELHYHSVNDSKYISELRTALKEKGLYDEDEIELELKLKDEFKQKEFFKSGLIYLNEQIKNKNEGIKSFADLGVRKRNIEYGITSGYGQDKAVFHEKDFKMQSQDNITSEEVKLSDISPHIIQNALSKSTFFNFDNLKKFFPHLESIQEFATSEDYLAGLAITFSGRKKDLEQISNRHLLNAVMELAKSIENEIKGNTTQYKGSDEFKPFSISEKFFDKVLKLNKNSERINGQEDFVGNKNWYVFNANYGTSEEKKFVKMMDSQISKLSEQYKEIYLLRNELHVKIYNFHDGQGFAPDFILFLRQKNGESITYQIFIEPKGIHLKETDKWKEMFLSEIKERHKDKVIKFSDSKKYKITGVPFYNNENENEFKEALHSTLI
jgi:type III restriction enzyme